MQKNIGSAGSGGYAGSAVCNLQFSNTHQKLELLPTAFAVVLSAVALLVAETFELNFEVKLYIIITFFCFVKFRKLL